MAKQRKFNPAQLVFRLMAVVVLLVAVGLFLIDRQARREAQSAFDALQPLIDEINAKEKSGQVKRRPSPTDVQALIKRPADGPAFQKGLHMVETYTFHGGLQSYRVYVAYLQGQGLELDKVSLDQPIE